MKEKIYLIPGLMTDHRLWHRLVHHLNEYELIHTPLPLSEDFEEMAEILHKNFAGEKINLLGFSLGGYLASYYTLKYPQQVNRLFLVGSTPSATELKDIARREEKLQEARNDKFTPLTLEKARDLLEHKDDIELAQTVVDMFNDLGHKHFVPQLASTLNRRNLFDDLNELNIPIKFFYSKSDRLLNHTSIERIQEKEHRFELIAREGTSHNIPLEVPVCLSQEIRHWMKRRH